MTNYEVLGVKGEGRGARCELRREKGELRTKDPIYLCCVLFL